MGRPDRSLKVSHDLLFNSNAHAHGLTTVGKSRNEHISENITMIEFYVVKIIKTFQRVHLKLEVSMNLFITTLRWCRGSINCFQVTELIYLIRPVLHLIGIKMPQC